MYGEAGGFEAGQASESSGVPGQSVVVTAACGRLIDSGVKREHRNRVACPGRERRKVRSNSHHAGDSEQFIPAFPMGSQTQ